MANNRSFKNYVEVRFGNELYAAIYNSDNGKTLLTKDVRYAKCSNHEYAIT